MPDDRSPNATPPDLASPESARRAADAFRADVAAVRDQLAQVIVGQSDVIEGVIICLLCNGHALLEGVPGIGKTLLIRTLGKSLSMSFGRIQFTPDLMPADITGTTVVREVAHGSGPAARQFVFEPGPIFAQIVLADEINRATPKTQSALLEAMQERSVTAGGTTHRLPSPFFVMATQNPIEQEGTYPLPEAQLDRFFFKLQVSLPSRTELHEIVRRTTSSVAVEPAAVLDDSRLLAHQQLVRAVPAPEEVVDFAVRLVLATHPAGELAESQAGSSPSAQWGIGGARSQSDLGRFATPLVTRFVRLGASPRAAQALVLAAKCRALLDGRFVPGIDDVRSVALPALRHRIIINFEAQAEGMSADRILLDLTATLPLTQA